MANTCRHTDRGLVSVDGNIVHLVEVVVQEALLGVGLDDLAQGLSAQLLGGQSWRLAVDPLWRPDRAKEREEEEKSGTETKRQKHYYYYFPCQKKPFLNCIDLRQK